MLASFPSEFYLNYTVSIEMQGLSSTNCNFHGLSRLSISILKCKDIQGACEPCNNIYFFSPSMRKLNS